jgi:hypothetical protein
VKAFEEIAAETVKRLESVNCTVAEFVEGCSVVLEEVREAQRAAEECLRATGGDR